VDADGRAVYETVAWPWEVPVGSTVAFVWGYLLAGRRRGAAVRRQAVTPAGSPATPA